LNILPFCFAATDEDGEYEFHYSDASFCNGGNLNGLENDIDHRYPLKVAGKNLNRFLSAQYPHLLKNLSFIKIDTEGHDRDVLLSIKEIIRQHRPVIRTEVMNRLSADEAMALYDTLTEMQYRKIFEYQENGESICGPAITRETVKKDRTYDLIALPS